MTATPTPEIIDAAYRKVWSTVPHANRLTEFAKEIWQAATLSERERCALVCDHLAKRSFYAYDCADAIREGGAS